jgi:CRISPR-associated protein Csx16
MKRYKKFKKVNPDKNIKYSTSAAQCGQYYIVSRHPGAIEWLCARLPKSAKILAHLDDQNIPTGSTVVGTLPVHQIAQLANRGVRYLHLELNLPCYLRGKELTVTQLNELNAKLVPYFALRMEESAQ